MSRAGTTPRVSSRSTAAQIATIEPLSSRVPRPQTAPSWISAPNGGCCHGAVSSTGTTSRWAISTTGACADRPAQWKSSECSQIRCRVRCWCSSGNRSGRSAISSAKGAFSMADSSVRETVARRTSARNVSISSVPPTGET